MESDYWINYFYGKLGGLQIFQKPYQLTHIPSTDLAVPDDAEVQLLSRRNILTLLGHPQGGNLELLSGEFIRMLDVLVELDSGELKTRESDWNDEYSNNKGKIWVRVNKVVFPYGGSYKSINTIDVDIRINEDNEMLSVRSDLGEDFTSLKDIDWVRGQTPRQAVNSLVNESQYRVAGTSRYEAIKQKSRMHPQEFLDETVELVSGFYGGIRRE